MKKIFISGNFEFIQPGHVRLFKYAKEIGGSLIVGVFSDFLIDSKAKFHEQERVDSLKANIFVDEVVLISNSLIETLKAIKPNIVIKGVEFEHQENVEEKILEEWGGKLIFNSGDPSYSDDLQFENNLSENLKAKLQHDRGFLSRNNISFLTLQDTVTKFKNLEGIVLGDTILDEYINCDALGLSREDFNVVYQPKNELMFAGGSAIVAKHCAALSKRVHFFSLVGTDLGGEWIDLNLNNVNLIKHLFHDETSKTTLKQRFRHNNNTIFRLTKQNTTQLPKEIASVILSQVKKIISNVDFIIICDFGYGMISEFLVSELLELAKKFDVFVAADAQVSSQITNLRKFTNVEIIAPTEYEARAFLSDPNSGIAHLSKKLLSSTQIKNVILTLGSEGCLVDSKINLQHSKNSEVIHALNKHPVDIAGAGDSLLVVSTLAQIVNPNLLESAYLGSIAAGIQISSLGNRPIQTNQLLEALKN